MKSLSPKPSMVAILSSLLVLSQLGAEPYSPQIAEKSPEAERAVHAFKVPGGMSVQLVAAEPMLANPVAFCFDDKGRIFVAETFRQQKGVEDNRFHKNWLLDDLAARTVNDRIEYFRKHLKEDVAKYTREHDRIRLLTDTDGDGVADKSTVYADGFNAIEDGTGAGLLAMENVLYYTCIPKLWVMMDKDGDGVSDERQPLYDGFGVRVAFRGHDLHGLIVGPDGRLYFSIGDRGFNVELRDKSRLYRPDQGAVFRCELDGSNLEVFCAGLRNPQELAFDNFGNLFTGDNNSDSGDRARWVYLIEGSNSGWRMYYQYPDDRGPWNREKLWHTAFPGQPAYIVPPVAHFADGPSGLAYYPGTGLDDKYQNHFFLADFRGQSSNSGIRSFSLVPKGASFELVNSEQFIWSILATDVDFGIDSGVYVLDWVDGWEGNGKGRIYRFRDDTNAATASAKEVPELIKAGFASRSPKELVELLAHPDYRIRQRAQFALVKKNSTQELTAVATSGQTLLTRMHAIWGLGILGRQKPAVLSPVLKLLADKEPEIRAQMARVCGDCKYQDSVAALTKLLKDSNPRVQSLAAIAVGRLKHQAAFPTILEALAENANNDPTLRHALIMGLAGTSTVEQLVSTARVPVPAVRLAAVVALRRQVDPGLATFLNDSDPLVVEEAVRAIHDLPVPAAFASVSAMLGQPGLSDATSRRVLNANFRIGATENAQSVAAFAGNPLADEKLRVEAIRQLSDWNSPSPLDRVTNEYRALDDRQIDVAAVVRPWLGAYFGASPKIREAAARLANRHGIADVEPFLVEIVKDTKTASPSLRVAALGALHSLKSPKLNESIELALNDSEPAVRSEARKVLADIDPARTVHLLSDVHNNGSVFEQQAAILLLTGMKRDDADTILLGWLDKLLASMAKPEIHLDLLNAAKTRGGEKFQSKSDAYDQLRKPDDHLKDYRESEFGGDADRGREVYFSRSEASCRRCHKIDGAGGEVGPDLSRIGLDKKREYLLEAIVDPNRQVAKGFETAIVVTSDGKVYAGIVKREDEKRIQLQKPDGQMVTIEKTEIDDRAVGKSGMPDDIVKKLSKSEIRDLVEYLTTLKSDGATHGDQTR